MTEGRDVRRHGLQGFANISRQPVSCMAGNKDLHEAATALKFKPNTVALGGDHNVFDEKRVIHPNPFDCSQSYRAGVSFSVTKVNDARAFDKAFSQLCTICINGDHGRGDKVQLPTQCKRSVWRKRDIDAPGLNANGTGKPGNLRLCADKGARHLTKLSWCERPRATPAKGGTRAGVTQASSRILLCTARAPLQIGRLELHFIGHFQQLSRARAQASRLGQALVTLSPRQSTGSQVNHIHFPASYSRAHSARLVAGVTPEAKGNTP